MTCIEKYKLENHGEMPDLMLWCPNGSGGIDIDEPHYCPGHNGHKECRDCWNREVPGTDVVNHPEHYCRDDAMECIDEMLLIFGVEATMHFCLLNAWKYRYRAADKNGEEDLKKSDWYIAKYAELMPQFAELKGGD